MTDPQQLPVALRWLGPVQRRVVLTLRELLGTWEENAARFRAGQTVPGIVRAKTEYGVFIALTPNLCGLAERDDTLEPGQPGCVYIKAIHPETPKIKMTVLHRLDPLPPQPLSTRAAARARAATVPKMRPIFRRSFPRCCW